MTLLILVSIFLQICVALVSANPRCHGHYDCPKYEVIEKTHNYEVRKYPAYKFAESRVTGVHWYVASHFNFMRLFHYIFGNNEEKVRIPMTVPVLTPIMIDEDREFKDDYTMNFWLPEKYQCEGCAPAPIKTDHPENDVQLVVKEEMTVYVRSFPGYAYETNVKYNEMKLKENLEKDGLVAGEDFDDSRIILAGYNSPMHFFGRTNEVMFEKKAGK